VTPSDPRDGRLHNVEIYAHFSGNGGFYEVSWDGNKKRLYNGPTLFDDDFQGMKSHFKTGVYAGYDGKSYLESHIKEVFVSPW
jgi:hypothetical protein